MKSIKYYTVSIFLFSLILAVGCKTNSEGYDSFDWELLGTWESTPNEKYSGRITISHDTIRIDNYDVWQTYLYGDDGDDKERPFQGIPRGITLKGYSEDSRIFIEGFSPEGIPYELIDTKVYYNDYILRFNFGGRSELLQKIDE